MIPKDFFRVVLKILSLLIVVNGMLPIIPNVFLWFRTDISSGFYMIGSVLFYLAIIYVMLYKTDFLIKLFRLDKGFNSNEFNFSNVNSSSVIKVSCVLLGLYVIISNLPQVVSECFTYFQKTVSPSIISRNLHFEANNYVLQISIINIVVGLIFIALRSYIAQLFVKSEAK